MVTSGKIINTYTLHFVNSLRCSSPAMRQIFSISKNNIDFLLLLLPHQGKSVQALSYAQSLLPIERSRCHPLFEVEQKPSLHGRLILHTPCQRRQKSMRLLPDLSFFLRKIHNLPNVLPVLLRLHDRQYLLSQTPLNYMACPHDVRKRSQLLFGQCCTSLANPLPIERANPPHP